VASLFGEEKSSLDADTLNNVFRSDLLPLEVKWACICAWKELRFTGCCFLDESPCCGCLAFAEVQLSVSRERMSSVPSSSLVSSSFSSWAFVVYACVLDMLSFLTPISVVWTMQLACTVHRRHRRRPVPRWHTVLGHSGLQLRRLKLADTNYCEKGPVSAVGQCVLFPTASPTRSARHHFKMWSR